VGYYFVTKSSANPTTTYPLPFPTTLAEAQSTLIQLDVLWWQSAAQSPGNTTYRNSLDAEATAIRAQFPSAGPASGYTCNQLVGMGSLTQSVCTQAQANGYSPTT
jgi:hypothetical protein